MSKQRFISTYAGTLDSKGRVCIPAPWRQVLAAQETGGVYLCPSINGGALDGFGQALMDVECDRLETMDPFFSELHDEIASQIVAESVCLPIDENGRVRLPEEMIKAGSLKDRVLFVGLGRKFEIWDPEAYAPVKAARQAGARAERVALASREGAAAPIAPTAPATPPAGEGAP